MEENTLVAHNVGYRTISEIGMPLKDVYLSNCFLNITEYKQIISELMPISQLYIINGQLTFDFYKRFLGTFPCLKEVLLHNVCALAFDDLAALTFSSVECNLNASTVLITGNKVLLHNPTSKQLAVVLQLNLLITKCKFLNCQLKSDVFYQIVTILTSIPIKSVALEIHLIHTNFGNIENEVMLAHVVNSSTSISKLSVSFSKFNLSMVPVFVNIVCAWNIEELVVCYQDYAIFTCLIKKLKEKRLIRKCRNEVTLSIAYGRCFTSTIKIEKN